MRVLVCGSRSWKDIPSVFRTLDDLAQRNPTDEVMIVHGNAVGPDRSAKYWARVRGCKEQAFPAQWQKYGKRAGIVRNLEMLDTNPDLVLAFWDGESKGTNHTITAAKERGIPVEVVEKL